MIRLASGIATRFGIVVSQKVAAQTVPVVPTLGGAAVNAAFMDHYQDLAGPIYRAAAGTDLQPESRAASL